MLRPLLLARPAILTHTRRCLTTANKSNLGGYILTGPTGNKIQLPPAEGPVGPISTPNGTVNSYVKALYCPVTHTLRTSAHVGIDSGGAVLKGTVGSSPGCISETDARVAARGSGLRLLATVHAALGGDMDRVEQVTMLRGLVNAENNFDRHGAVINGCSEVLIEAFGPEKGVGVRMCSGTASLSGAVSCDVELRVRPK